MSDSETGYDTARHMSRPTAARIASLMCVSGIVNAGRDATRPLAVHPHVLDPGAAHDEPVGTAGLVLHALHRRDADRVRIERDEVGEVAGTHEAAVGDAER